MWGIRGDINPAPMPARRMMIQVIFTDLPRLKEIDGSSLSLVRESIFVLSILVSMWTYIYRPICGR
jgi:hypothetical protein